MTNGNPVSPIGMGPELLCPKPQVVYGLVIFSEISFGLVMLLLTKKRS